MCSKTVAKRVGMDAFLDARSLGGVMTRMPNRFRIDRQIPAVAVVAGKEPHAGFSPQAVPMCVELFEEHGTEHDVAIFASLASLDVNHQALVIDIADLQMRQLSTARSGGIERHQNRPMGRRAGRIDELNNFFLAEDRRKAMAPFWIRSVGDAPSPSERLGVEEPQGRQTDRNCAR